MNGNSFFIGLTPFQFHWSITDRAVSETHLWTNNLMRHSVYEREWNLFKIRLSFPHLSAPYLSKKVAGLKRYG